MKDKRVGSGGQERELDRSSRGTETGTPSLTILTSKSDVHGANLREKLEQVLVSGAEGEIADENLRSGGGHVLEMGAGLQGRAEEG